MRSVLGGRLQLPRSRPMTEDRQPSFGLMTVAGAECLRGNPPVEFRESDANCIDIGLVINMPDAALKATERQFLTLLDAAADGMVVRLTFYALPDVPRTDAGRGDLSGAESGGGAPWHSLLERV